MLSCLEQQLVEGIEETVGVGKSSSKMYATIGLGKARVGRTRTLTEETETPRWDESFHVYCAHLAADVVFTIKSKSTIGASTVGVGYLPVRDVFDGRAVDTWLPLCEDDSKDRTPGSGKLHVKLQYFDIAKDHAWGRGVRSGKYPGVPYTFFPQRQGCRVTLYQDAHIPDAFTPGSRSPAARATRPTGAGRTSSTPSPARSTWCTSRGGQCTLRSRWCVTRPGPSPAAA